MKSDIFEPIHLDVHKPMNNLARAIDLGLNGEAEGPNPRYCFILLVAEFGKIEDGRLNHISNGELPDMIAMLREYLARVEGRVADSPAKPQ